MWGDVEPRWLRWVLRVVDGYLLVAAAFGVLMLGVLAWVVTRSS
ncbi:MAG: hypothetical protein ACTHQ3_14640 [Motilibacteraceae bacterium]